MSTWYRLEPNSSDLDLSEAVQARVADPLWSLARQWQLGEFKGEDAASPVRLVAEVETTPLVTFRNEAARGADVERFPRDIPLESRVEAETVEDGPGAVALAAHAGVQFLRRLDQAGLGEFRRSVDWPAVLGFDEGATATDGMRLAPRDASRLGLVTRRGLDGRRLLTLTAAGLARLAPEGVDMDERRLAEALDLWRQEQGRRFVQPEESGDCWADSRLEYSFSVGAATPEGEVVLQAAEYAGGHLDWYAFDVARGADSHGLPARKAEARRIELLPQPLTFNGQPAPRWWEFEDRSVYFGALSAGPADPARLVVAEFAAALSDDWFVAPVRVSTASLTRVTAVRILDTFGGRTTVEAAAVNDHRIHGPDRPFRCFELAGDASAVKGSAPWLLVVPTLTDSQLDAPVERVTLRRDEQANLVWAVEDIVESPNATPLRRRLQWRTAEEESTDTGTTAAADTGSEPEDVPWRYRLQRPVPPWWVPFTPERAAGSASIRLRRARLQAWAEEEPGVAGAQGRIIGARRPFWLEEEEVPRGGVEVTRRWQWARSADGRPLLWVARRKRPAQPHGVAGLRFDEIRRTEQGGASQTRV